MNQTQTKEVNTMARKSTALDRTIFENAVKTAEANGPLKNLGALYDAIASAYTLAVIALKQTTFCSPTLAKKWLEEWGIETLTEPGRKGRPAKESFLAAKLATLREACVVIMEGIPADYQHLIASIVEIIDEKPETTTETAEIEEETLPPILPEQTETVETEQTDEQRQAA